MTDTTFQYYNKQILILKNDIILKTKTIDLRILFPPFLGLAMLFWIKIILALSTKNAPLAHVR